MTTGAYATGFGLVTIVVGSLAVTGVWIKRIILPGWSDAPARLAEVVLALRACPRRRFEECRAAQLRQTL